MFNCEPTTTPSSNKPTVSKSILKPSTQAPQPQFLSSIKDEDHLETHLQSNLQDCISYLDTPATKDLDLDFFYKVKEKHQEYENQQMLEELKDMAKNNQHNAPKQHPNLDLSMEDEGLRNKNIKAKNPK